jgi:hypothetical protein
MEVQLIRGSAAWRFGGMEIQLHGGVSLVRQLRKTRIKHPRVTCHQADVSIMRQKWKTRMPFMVISAVAVESSPLAEFLVSVISVNC